MIHIWIVEYDLLFGEIFLMLFKSARANANYLRTQLNKRIEARELRNEPIMSSITPIDLLHNFIITSMY